MKNPTASFFPDSFKIIICFHLFFFILLASVCTSGERQNENKGEGKYSVEEAFKVLGLIEKIEAAQMETMQPGPDSVRKVEVTESEFNSYIAYRIDVEKEEIMRALQLKFFDENKVEGRIFIDLKGQNLPAMLKPEMNVFFTANIETDQGAVRLNLKDLFLENRRVMPAVLDLIIAISAKLSGEEATSISDWYELPYGIKEIVIRTGKAEFYY
jgi:hypothetical protein